MCDESKFVVVTNQESGAEENVCSSCNEEMSVVTLKKYLTKKINTALKNYDFLKKNPSQLKKLEEKLIKILLRNIPSL